MFIVSRDASELVHTEEQRNVPCYSPSYATSKCHITKVLTRIFPASKDVAEACPGGDAIFS